MEKHEIIRELAQAVYDDNLRHNVRWGEKEDWAFCERMWEWFEDKRKPQDYVYSYYVEWRDYQKFYEIYLRCKHGK